MSIRYSAPWCCAPPLSSATQTYLPWAVMATGLSKRCGEALVTCGEEPLAHALAGTTSEISVTERKESTTMKDCRAREGPRRFGKGLSSLIDWSQLLFH